MIIREILTDPAKHLANFDYANDYSDTMAFLVKERERIDNVMDTLRKAKADLSFAELTNTPAATAGLVAEKPKRVLTCYVHINTKIYTGEGLTLQRDGETQRWVLRNALGQTLDHDQYRDDLAQRNNLELICA